MRPFHFLLSSLFCFLLIVSLYVFAVAKWALPERPVPFPYSQFLLEASAEIAGKVVIDSGSNALFGMDAKLLSEYFGAPTIIVADVASYPLRKKILRLGRSLQPGDVLILPLEWDSYSSPKTLSKKFVERVANKHLQLSHYVEDLPVLELLKFILTEYPMRNAMESLLFPRDFKALRRDSFDRLDRFEATIAKSDNSTYGGTQRDGPEKMNYIAKLIGSCDRYLFERKKQLRMRVSDTFREDLELLQQLRHRGVSIYFSWPNVVDSADSKCYGDPNIMQYFDDYVSEVKNAIEDSGFSIVGKPRGYHFSQECFLNTFYHLRWSCAERRTGLLISDLQEAGALPIGEKFEASAYEAFVLGKIEAVREAKSVN